MGNSSFCHAEKLESRWLVKIDPLQLVNYILGCSFCERCLSMSKKRDPSLQGREEAFVFKQGGTAVQCHRPWLKKRAFLRCAFFYGVS